MKPIYERADIAFMQALRCVEFRVPKLGRMKRPGYLAALGLRYGMIGVAASHHLLITADDDEEIVLLELIGSYPRMVEDHIRWDLERRLPLETSKMLPIYLAKLSAHPLETYFPLYRRLCPLDHCLRVVMDAYVEEHSSAIRDGWGLFLRRRAVSDFREMAEQSAYFAKQFFERRQADLDELPEIALIGE
jgi:hypothetical protein